MAKKIIIFIFFVLSTQVHLNLAAFNNICLNYIKSYQQKYSTNYFYKKARTEHLLELVSSSSNKFDLINNIYLHYMSIRSTKDMLSINLELCLFNLLKLNRENNLFRSKNKQEDRNFKLISGFVVNKNYFNYNIKSLYKLRELDHKEENIIQVLFLEKRNFDEALKADKPAMSELEYHKRLLGAYEEVMEVFYEGHTIFAEHNIKLVKNFMRLVKNSSHKKRLEKLLVIYKDSPTARNYHEIKALVRALYGQITGKHMISPSASELWEKLITKAEEIRLEISSDNIYLYSELKNIEKLYDSNKKTTIRNAADRMIEILGTYDENIKDRIYLALEDF